MRRAQREHQRVVFLGIREQDEDCVFVCRIDVVSVGGRTLQRGPIREMHVPWAAMYTDEIAAAMNREHATRLRLFDMQLQRERLAEQDPLF